MPTVPGLKQTGESCLIHSPQIRGNSSQVDGSLQLGITGEVSGQDRLLVKVTHLLGNPLKEPKQSRFSIGDDCLDLEALTFNLFPDQTIFPNAFCLNEPIGDHRFAPGILRDQDSEFVSVSSEESGIKNQRDTPRLSAYKNGFVGMNFPLDTGSGSLIFSGEFLEGGTVVEVLLE